MQYGVLPKAIRNCLDDTGDMIFTVHGKRIICKLIKITGEQMARAKIQTIWKRAN